MKGRGLKEVGVEKGKEREGEGRGRERERERERVRSSMRKVHGGKA